MGYRSDVAIGLAFVNKAAARDFVLKVQACQPEDVRQALTEYSVVLGASEQEPVLFLGYYEDVKWYPTYPDVIAHATLSTLAEEAGAATRFVRIGDELCDDDDSSSSADGGDYQVHEKLLDHLLEAISITRRVSCDIPPDGSTPLSLI